MSQSIPITAGTCINNYGTSSCATSDRYSGTAGQLKYTTQKALASSLQSICNNVKALSISFATVCTQKSTLTSFLYPNSKCTGVPVAALTTVSYSNAFIASFSLSTDVSIASTSFTFTATGSISTESTNTVAKWLANYFTSFTFVYTFDGTVVALNCIVCVF